MKLMEYVHKGQGMLNMIYAKIHEIKFWGYERGILLELCESKRKAWVYCLDTEKYVECLESNTIIDIPKRQRFSIEWVTDIRESCFSCEELIQNIDDSSHIECKVIVTKVISLDSFECFSEDFGIITVELEQDVSFIKEGSKVAFEGNLRVDIF